jgi:hypothetical protein
MPIPCAGAPGSKCALKVLLTASGDPVKGASLRVAASARGAQKVTVGIASAKVPPGTTKTVSASLNSLRKMLLGKFHRLRRRCA